MTPELQAKMEAVYKTGCQAALTICGQGWIGMIQDTNLRPDRLYAVGETPEEAWEKVEAKWSAACEVANA